MMFLFVIDTTDYAGNFERDMCAYMTGCVGDCGVGTDYALLFLTQTGADPLEGVMELRDEGDGAWRPCTIHPTPGRVDECSVAIYFESEPSKETCQLLMQRARAFLNEPKLNEFDHRPEAITGFRVVRRVVELTTFAQYDPDGTLSKL